MEEQIEIEAFYDCLSIGYKLDDFLDGFERREIHLFSYFSAFLSHYRGNPVDDWKYKFVIDQDGYPHSKQLDDAIERQIIRGSFESKNIFLSITGRGAEEFNHFHNELELFKEREKFIEAACNTSILIPYQETKMALLEDTNLQKAKKSGNEDWIDFEYENLQKITQALGAPIDDIVVSAVSWIRHILYLINEKTI